MPTEIINPDFDCRITNTRIFNVSQTTFFQAWAEPEHLIKWWGPKGFTNTFHEFDFNVGGIWRFTMHGPYKGHFENECEFIKIEKSTLIAWKRNSKPHFQVLALFDKISEQSTKLSFNMVFETVEACQKLKPFVIDKNEENFDKLEQELAKMLQTPKY